MVHVGPLEFQDDAAAPRHLSVTDVEESLIHYLGRVSGRAISGSTRLIEDRVLDSIGLIELLAWVEGRYDVSFSAVDLETAFRDVGTLATRVAGKTGGS